MNKVIIKLIGKLRFLFSRPDVDFDQLLLILETKLTIDNRRSRVNLQGQAVKESKYIFIKQLAFIFVLSSLMAMFIIFLPTPVMSFSIYSAYLMVTITMILITDFSSVIMDTSDFVIVYTRPVSSRTLFLSRLIHTFIYLLQLSLAILLPAIIVTAYKYGFITAVVFTILSLFLVLMTLFLTNLFYLLVMRFFSEEKLKNIINLVQIGIAIVLMSGYRLVMNFFSFDSLENIDNLQIGGWHFVLPPMWVGFLMDTTITSKFQSNTWVLLVLIIGIPLVSLYYMTSKLINGFGGRLGSIDDSKKGKKSVENKKDISELLSKFIFKSGASRANFEFIWKMTSRDRNFKLKTFPMVAYLLISMPTIFLVNKDKSLNGMLELAQSQTWMVFYMIYMTSIIMNVVRQNVVFYEKPLASWVFATSSIRNPGELFLGQLYAIAVKYLMIFFIPISFIILSVWGFEYLDDIFFGIFIAIISQQVLYLSIKYTLPFSLANEKPSGAQTIFMLLQMFFVGIVGYLHNIISHVSYVILIGDIMAIVLLVILNKEIKKIGWEKVNI
ncbi:hypothetical protein EGI22_05210 [Lacihabitans sp. LS3-19]|uniref:hypothetical protein n=1 Tax=Lacihabitans sp. LS3-19 TaxID=2487335 RepID=UPI0020CC08E7|nr:hypothetical protein [Lacihabitans sp. LS3-19]MCP9767299.1 hypothetical protein [Lacihabitans sp. LS3-19]